MVDFKKMLKAARTLVALSRNNMPTEPEWQALYHKCLNTIAEYSSAYDSLVREKEELELKVNALSRKLIAYEAAKPIGWIKPYAERELHDDNWTSVYGWQETPECRPVYLHPVLDEQGKKRN